MYAIFVCIYLRFRYENRAPLRKSIKYDWPDYPFMLKHVVTIYTNKCKEFNARGDIITSTFESLTITNIIVVVSLAIAKNVRK